MRVPGEMEKFDRRAVVGLKQALGLTIMSLAFAGAIVYGLGLMLFRAYGPVGVLPVLLVGLVGGWSLGKWIVAKRSSTEPTSCPACGSDQIEFVRGDVLCYGCRGTGRVAGDVVVGSREGG